MMPGIPPGMRGVAPGAGGGSSNVGSRLPLRGGPMGRGDYGKFFYGF